MMSRYFTHKILKWSHGIDRPMPWKGEKNPYLVWLSEIILQQTRVNQGLPYFIRFRERFPDVASLATAPEDEVLKLWQGLGYYSRARNLHQAAKVVHEQHGGDFPQTFEELRKLKGIGEYTAAAIASFAFDKRHAVVDGNVFRVLSRFFGIETPIDDTKGKKQFKELADQLISEKNPGAYNQAIMDFGSLQCVPKNPDCGSCPLKRKCKAYSEGMVERLPVKSKRVKQRTRYFHYLVINNNGNLLLSKRVGKDIWQNLYEFPLIESDRTLTVAALKKTKGWKEMMGGGKVKKVKFSGEYTQILTHQKIKVSFYEIWITDGQRVFEGKYVKTRKEFLNKFAFPKIIDCFLKDKILYSGVN